MKNLNWIAIGLTLVSIFTNIVAHAQVSMNDVSFLLPIPKTAIELKTHYFHPATLLTSGSLLSSAKLKLFDWSVASTDTDMRVKANSDRLAVLGIRLDPCFQDLFSDSCRPQIRLVVQPVVFTGTTPDTADTGIHLFFDTTNEKIVELIRFAAKYRNQFLGSGSAKSPLQINPVLNQEGMGGNFWKAFKPMLMAALNQAAPSRVAFFAMLPSERAWEFQSFNIKGNAVSVIMIEGANTSLQLINNRAPNSNIEFLAGAGVIPRATAGSDQTFDFLNDSVSFKRNNNSKLLPLFTSVERLENPRAHLPGTVDCLSCHSTPSIRTNFAKTNLSFPTSGQAFKSSTFQETSLFNVTERHFEGRDFRLFGYRDAKPLIGQRVINESAAIIDSLAGQL